MFALAYYFVYPGPFKHSIYLGIDALVKLLNPVTVSISNGLCIPPKGAALDFQSLWRQGSRFSLLEHRDGGEFQQSHLILTRIHTSREPRVLSLASHGLLGGPLDGIRQRASAIPLPPHCGIPHLYHEWH